MGNLLVHEQSKAWWRNDICILCLSQRKRRTEVRNATVGLVSHVNRNLFQSLLLSAHCALLLAKVRGTQSGANLYQSTDNCSHLSYWSADQNIATRMWSFLLSKCYARCNLDFSHTFEVIVFDGRCLFVIPSNILKRRCFLWYPIDSHWEVFQFLLTRVTHDSQSLLTRQQLIYSSMKQTRPRWVNERFTYFDTCLSVHGVGGVPPGPVPGVHPRQNQGYPQTRQGYPLERTGAYPRQNRVVPFGQAVQRAVHRLQSRKRTFLLLIRYFIAIINRPDWLIHWWYWIATQSWFATWSRIWLQLRNFAWPSLETPHRLQCIPKLHTIYW